MPTYEYQCEKCNQTFEAFQSMKDDAFVVCPRNLCRLESWGEGKVKRLLGTGAGLIFKGSGFHITDYRSPSYKESAKKESGSATTDGAKGSLKESAGSVGNSGASGKTPAKSD
ncbi:MAG: zinc ribbon domain-containing protein [Verrucomicrobia bacterium]|jgi:putative FmdB family regulatory protein|nr:zinc ribbon domain-containing protein [Verrucomicrobiota bacterium]